MEDSHRWQGGRSQVRFRPIALAYVATAIMMIMAIKFNYTCYLSQYTRTRTTQWHFTSRITRIHQGSHQLYQLPKIIRSWISGKTSWCCYCVCLAIGVVYRKKLFARLHFYGIRGNLSLWLVNFFSGRTRCTKVGNNLFDFLKLISGVVQCCRSADVFDVFCISMNCSIS